MRIANGERDVMNSLDMMILDATLRQEQIRRERDQDRLALAAQPPNNRRFNWPSIRLRLPRLISLRPLPKVQVEGATAGS
jgi:hypothetical protein